MPSDGSDIEAVRSVAERIAAGEPDAYRELLEARWRALYGYAYLITWDRSAAHGALARGLVHAFRSLEKRPPSMGFLPFALKGVRHEARRALALRGETDRPAPRFDEGDREAANHDLREGLVSAPALRAVGATLYRMPEAERDAWLQAHLLGLSVEESAYAMDDTPEAVRALRTEARRMLEDRLGLARSPEDVDGNSADSSAPGAEGAEDEDPADEDDPDLLPI